MSKSVTKIPLSARQLIESLAPEKSRAIREWSWAAQWNLWNLIIK